MDSNVKKLPLADIFKQSYDYCRQNFKFAGVFALVNFFLLLLGFYTWSTLLFLPVAVLGYILWSVFFRFYFDKKPYFQIKPLFQSLVPSTKILVVSFLIIFVLMSLPFLPPFIGLPPEYADAYARFLHLYMEETDVLDLALNLIFILISPLILYRPFFAWIAALLGRSGSLRMAWGKTRGNYWQFVMLVIIFNSAFLLIGNVFSILPGGKFFEFLLRSPLFVYFNVVLAKAYEFFFLKA